MFVELQEPVLRVLWKDPGPSGAAACLQGGAAVCPLGSGPKGSDGSSVSERGGS